MQGLEKILEEVNRLIEKHKNNAYELVAKEPLTQCYTETDIEQTKVHELAVVRDIIRKHMNDGWTPVDERLPEEEQEVWVSAKTDCVRRGTYTKHFGAEHKEGFICSDGFMWMNTANAWQPYVVPEPYRPERSV